MRGSEGDTRVEAPKLLMHLEFSKEALLFALVDGIRVVHAPPLFRVCFPHLYKKQPVTALGIMVIYTGQSQVRLTSNL